MRAAKATVLASDRWAYIASDTARGFRALADIASEIDIDCQTAKEVADSVEAVERLQELRKELLELGGQAKQLGLSTPSLAAVDLLQRPEELQALIAQVEQLIRRERERQLELEEAEKARRDMRMLMSLWLAGLASCSPRRAVLDDMAQMVGHAIEARQAMEPGVNIETELKPPDHLVASS